jgi:hypothetical protein
MTRMTNFVEDLLLEIREKRNMIFKECFAIDLGVANMIQEEDFTRTKLVDRVETELQANRLALHLGRRLSELLYLLRKIHAVLIVKLIPKLFGKRSCFERH